MLVEPEEYIFEDDEPDFGDELGRKKKRTPPKGRPQPTERELIRFPSEIGL